VLRAMWMPKGRQVRIPTPGSNRKRTVFGGLDLVTGQWCYQVYERKRSIEFLAFLEHLICVCPGRPLVLVLDNASIHKAKVVQAWLTEHPQVQLLSLPSYSGHKHNPVEKIWWRLKDRIAANRLHGSIDVLVETVHEFFASFTPEDALQLAA
jgi:transposase